MSHTHTPCMIAKTNNTKMLRRGQCDSCGVLPSFGHSAQGTPGRHVIQLHQSSASCGQCKQRNTWHPMVSNLCCIFPVGLLPQEKITTTYPPIAFFSGTIFLGDKPTGKLLGRSISWHARNLQWSRKYHQTRYDIVHRFRYDMIIGSQEKMHDMSNHTHTSLRRQMRQGALEPSQFFCWSFFEPLVCRSSSDGQTAWPSAFWRPSSSTPPSRASPNEWTPTQLFWHKTMMLIFGLACSLNNWFSPHDASFCNSNWLY